MPNRIVYEKILTSERVNRLSEGAELFYRRLMQVVDDYGKFHAHPKILLSACYPLRVDSISPTTVSTWLQECANCGLVRLFAADGKQFLQIDDFKQRIRGKPKFPDGQMQAIVSTSPTIVSTSPPVAAEKNNPVPAPNTNTYTHTTTTTAAGGFDIELCFQAYQKIYPQHLVTRIADCRAAYAAVVLGTADPVGATMALLKHLRNWNDWCERNPQKKRLGLLNFLHGGDCMRDPPQQDIAESEAIDTYTRG